MRPPSTDPRGDAGLRAARLARRLLPAVADLDGFVSTQLLVRVGGSLRRPAVSVVLGQPPVDGVLDGAPDLAVELAPAVRPEEYLSAGAPAVWVVAAGGATVLTRAGARRCGPTGLLTVPGRPELELPAAVACAAVG